MGEVYNILINEGIRDLRVMMYLVLISSEPA